MIVSEGFSLDGPRDRVAALLVDVESVRARVPGVTVVTKPASGEYRARTLMVALWGRFKSRFVRRPERRHEVV